MTRDQVLAIVDGAYAARQKNDKDALARYWAPDATFHMVGTQSLLDGVAVGPADAQPTVEQLIDAFEFDAIERTDAVVEGRRAAVRWKLTVSVRGRAGSTIVTELFDLIDIDEAGRIASLTQFTDTAALRQQISSTSAPSSGQ